MKLQNQHILIVSNEPWGETWFSKHNYAWELAKNNKVYFINPPVPFSITNWFKKNITEEHVSSNLTAVTYKNFLPVRIEFLRKINESLIFKNLNRYLKLKAANNAIFWTFDPLRLSSPELLNPKLIILHAVDKYRFTKPTEFILSKKAHIIICVAEEIAEIYRDKNKNVHVIPHAIASDEIIEKKKPRGEKLSGVFVGNIDKRIDFEYTAHIISKFPQVDFHFVGKISEEDCASDLVFKKNFPNVIHHGEKPFKQLKKFISDADFCILFKVDEVGGNKISSHKMLQYFAQGKPIFASHLTQYNDIKDLLYMSDDKNEMTTIFANFIKNGEDDQLFSKRIEYAKKHSFENTISKIETLI